MNETIKKYYIEICIIYTRHIICITAAAAIAAAALEQPLNKIVSENVRASEQALAMSERETVFQSTVNAVVVFVVAAAAAVLCWPIVVVTAVGHHVPDNVQIFKLFSK